MPESATTNVLTLTVCRSGDDSEVRCNGRLVAGRFMSKKTSLTLGALELGNWTTNAKTPGQDYIVRDFHGRMDDFALLSRPLTSEEIKHQFEIGRSRQSITAVAELKSADAK